MDRRDRKKSARSDPNWNAPSREVDASTVELSGSRQEADLLVTAMKVLVLEKQKLEALTGQSHGSIAAQQLLESIMESHYVEIPVSDAGAESSGVEGGEAPDPKSRELLISSFRVE